MCRELKQRNHVYFANWCLEWTLRFKIIIWHNIEFKDWIESSRTVIWYIWNLMIMECVPLETHQQSIFSFWKYHPHCDHVNQRFVTVKNQIQFNLIADTVLFFHLQNEIPWNYMHSSLASSILNGIRPSNTTNNKYFHHFPRKLNNFQFYFIFGLCTKTVWKQIH